MQRYQEHSNRPTDFSYMTKTNLFVQNGGHFEKGVILDFQMATKLQDVIPMAFKTYERTPISLKRPSLFLFWTNPDF